MTSSSASSASKTAKPAPNFIDSFKSVQDFASKEITRPDGQQDWLAWKNEPNNPDRKRKLDKRAEEEPKLKAGEEEEVFVPKTHVKTKEELQVWTELRDAQSQAYWFNSLTGERTRKKPKSVQEDEDAKLACKPKEEKEIKKGANEPPPPPPQVWKRTVDPLTRRPSWMCAEDKIVIGVEPKPHPWRAVAVPPEPGRPAFYWWNVETKETAWT